jgi:hypothetical protein
MLSVDPSMFPIPPQIMPGAIALFLYTSSPRFVVGLPTAFGPWTPVTGQWTNVADAPSQVASVLATKTGSLIGAYAWDGQKMSEFFATI